MPALDRDELIDLLERLGSPDDAQALGAARLIDRRVRDAGARWADLLTAADGGIAADDDDDDDAEPDAPLRPAPDLATDLDLIDHMLADYDLAPQTRQDLEDMKADVAEGEFTDRDARYLRDLHARLDRGRRS